MSMLMPAGETSAETSWDGHPAASYAWIRAAAQTSPAHRWVVLGTITSPTAILTMRVPFHTPILYPIGYHHGGFETLYGQHVNEAADALARLSTRYAAYLPFCSSELTTAIKGCSSAASVRHHDVAPVVHRSDPDEYLASRPRKLRATIRRAEREFAELGGKIERVSFHDFSTAVPHLAPIEADGHRTSGRILNGRHANFLQRALREFHNEGVLELWVARIAESYVGYLVAINGPQCTYLWTMSIAKQMADLSLGSAIFYRAIAYSLGRGRAINLGTGGTSFKRRFATAELQLYDVLLIPPYAVGARELLNAMPETKSGGRWQ